MKMPPPIATKFTKLVLTILAITILGIILSFISQDHTLLMLSAGVAVAGGVKIIDYYRTIKGEHYECIEGTLVREQAGYGDGYLDITNLQELPVMLTNLIVRSLPH